MVMCLCKLHNCLVDARLLKKSDKDDMPPPLASDILEITANGGVPLSNRGGGGEGHEVPVELMDGGHHFDDTTPAFRRQFMRRGVGDAQLPRERLKEVIRFGGFQRPLPGRWQSND